MVFPMREPSFDNDAQQMHQRYGLQEKDIKTFPSQYQQAKLRLERMDNESSANKQMLSEIYDIVDALHQISTQSNKDKNMFDGTNDTLEEIKEKLSALDKKWKAFMLYTAGLEGLKNAANSLIVDQEKQIQNLLSQVSLLQDHLHKKEKRQANPLPDTSYSTQISSMKETIKRLEGKIEAYEEEKANKLSKQITLWES